MIKRLIVDSLSLEIYVEAVSERSFEIRKDYLLKLLESIKENLEGIKCWIKNREELKV